MNKSILYIHGYGSSGNAVKAQQLREMFPSVKVVSPTFEYNDWLPEKVQQTIREVVESENVGMLFGSSFGGYHAICATAFFDGPVWCINPVHEIEDTIQRIVKPRVLETSPERENDVEKYLKAYKKFDKEVFRNLPRREGQLHFALSTDDEVLGDHHSLLEMFPHYAKVVWKDDNKHRFLRLLELKDDLAESLKKTMLGIDK